MPVFKTNLMVVEVDCKGCHHYFKTEVHYDEVEKSEKLKVQIAYTCPECGESFGEIVKSEHS